MKDTDIFTSGGYDMVVAVTQKSINDQLAHLADPDIGTINTNLIIEMTFSDDGETMIPHIHTSWDHVEKNSKGVPLNPAINAQYMPSVNIAGSGTSVEFTLTFINGQSYMRNPISGAMMAAKDMTGWVYAIDIDLDFAGISNGDIKAGMAVPANVLKQLDNFTTDQFSVSSLFINFQSTDLMRFNPVSTSTGNAGSSAQAFFTAFMAEYLGAVSKDQTNNPYILGYSITNTPQTVATDANELATIPDSMKPVGNTFNVFQDTVNSDISTINFVLNTKLSGGNITPGTHSTPGNFDTNWISASDQCDGKMIYSTFCFLETIILRPFYQSYAQSTQDQVTQCLSISSSPNTWDSAMSVATSGDGMHFNAFNQTGTNDDYTNSYDVTWSPTVVGCVINLSGTIYIKKTMTKDMLFCTAVAWKSITLQWSSTISLNYGYDKEQDKPSITTVGPQIKIVNSSTDSGKNSCADAWGTIGDIFGSFLDFFTAFQDGGFLADLFSDTTGIGHFTMPAVNVALGTVSAASSNAFMLPAGDIFFFNDLSILPEGPISMGITYKTPTDGQPESIAEPVASGPQGAARLAIKGPAKKVRVDPDIQTVRTHWSTKLALGNSKNIKAAAQPVKPKKMTNGFANHSAATTAVVDQTSDTPPPTDFSQPLMDRFSLSPSDTSSIKDPIDISVSCELMSNSEAGMPVAPNHDMIVVQDSNSQALIFTIGSDAKFNLLTGSETSTGWTATNLLDSFTNYTSATCFDVVQDINGNISIAMALQQQNGSLIDLYYASLLSNDLSQTDFTKLASLAPLVKGVDSAFSPESIRLGSSDDGKRPMLTVEGSLNGKHLLYQMDVADAKATRLELPEDMNPGSDSLISQCTGFNFGQRGNYFLYSIGDTRHLVVRTSTLSYDYSPGNGELPAPFQQLTYNCIQTATSRSGAMFTASDIYIGTPRGLYRIPNGKAGSMELVTDSIVDVHDIAVTMNGDDIALWVTSSPDKLYYVYGHRTSSLAVTWNMPTVFASSVLRVAAMRNLVKSSNELFILTTDLALWHYWQDPSSTLWRSSKAIVKEDAYVINFDSYTTHLHFESAGLPSPSQKVRITSSEWQYCTINGLKYSLDQDIPAEIEVDPSGNITIIEPAVDISPPILHIQSDDFIETINVYTSGKVITNLKSVTDGPSLQSAKAQDGTPVLSSSVTPDVANAVAANLSTLRDATAAQYPPALSGNTFVVVEKPASSANGTISEVVKHSLTMAMPTHHLPSDFAIGMKLEKGKWVPHTTASAQAHLASMSRFALSWDDVTNFAGDVWHHLEQLGDDIITGLKDTAVYLADGISFIISKAGDVLQFVLTIGDKVLQIVLESFVLVFKALSWILSLVGIDLSAILRWLGHLLGWDNIWDTHKLIATSLTNFINYGDGLAVEYIEKARASAKTFFETMDQDMKNAILPQSIQAQTPTSAAVAPSGPDLNTPQSNFVIYHLNNTASSNAASPQDDATTGASASVKEEVAMTNGHSSKAAMTNGHSIKAMAAPEKLETTADVPHTNPGEIAVNILEQFANDLIIPMAKTLKDKLGTDLDGLIDLLKHGSMDQLKVLIADAADTVISVIAEFVDGFLHFCEDVVNDIKDMLTQPLEIPFFTELYEFVCTLMGYDEPFTIINAMSFLVSIPLTTMMKIGGYGTITEHNDIMGMDDPAFPQKLVSTIQGALAGPQAQPMRVESKAVRFKAMQKTHLLAANDDGFEPPLWLSYLSASFGSINGIAAVIYNALDWDFLVVGQSAGWKKNLKLGLGVARLVMAAPMPKANVDAQAYEVRWIAWVITNGWRIFTNVLTPGNPVDPAPDPPVVPIAMPEYFQNGGSLGVNIVTEIMAIVCDARDGVSPLTWSGDIISNTGGAFSSLGKLLEKDLDSPEDGIPIKYVATFVAIGGNVVSFVSAAGTFVNAAEGKNVWTGVL